MSGDRPSISAELRPYVDRGESEQIDRLAERLQDAKPLPHPGFRAALRAGLEERRGARGAPWRPRRLRLTAAAYGGSGGVLLAIAYLAATGSGSLGF